MRLFISIEVPEDVKEYLTNIQEKLDDNTANKIKCVNKYHIHLTLKFLGEVEPDIVEEIRNNLKKISFNPFSVYLDKIGVFPSENYIRVVWVGLKPEDVIFKLQKSIDENLKKIFKKEKNFKAHLTLARVKFIDDKKKFIDKLKDIKIEKKKIDIDCFKLIKSTLTPQGPIYDDLGIFGK